MLCIVHMSGVVRVLLMEKDEAEAPSSGKKGDHRWAL